MSAGRDEAPGRTGTDDRWRRAVVAFGLLPPLALLAAEAFVFGDLEGFPLDDSWIHLRFARQLAAGAGLAFNDGELVAASTSPLWSALLALLALAPGSLAVWIKLAGVGAQVAAVDATYRLGRRLALSQERAALAALLVALSDWLVWSSLAGMEIGLFTALSLAAMIRHLDERASPSPLPPVSFFLFALAALARPEGLLLPWLAAADRIFRARPEGSGLELDRRALAPVAKGLLVALIVLVPVALAYAAMSGSPLPTTLGAKSTGPPRFVPELKFLAAILAILFPSQPLPVLAAAGGALVLGGRTGTSRDRGLLLPMWTCGMPVAMAMLSSGRELLVGNFGRYFFPLLPPLVLLGVLAADGVAFARFRWLWLGRLKLPLGALALVVLVAYPAFRTVRGGAHYLLARTNIEEGDVAVARWLELNVPPDALLAVIDIGVIKNRLPNRIVDLGGIVSPELQRYLARARAERGLEWPPALRLWLDEQRPEYVVVFPDWFPLLDAEPERFPVLHRVKIHNNIALGRDELAVYATPWTRSRPNGDR